MRWSVLCLLFFCTVGRAMHFDELYNSRRVIVIFSQAESTSLTLVKSEIKHNRCDIEERELDVYLVTESQVVELTTPTEGANAISELRLRALHSGAAFELVLIGKNGGVKARTEQPDDLSNFITLIDSMPMRQAEIKRRESNC